MIQAYLTMDDVKSKSLAQVKFAQVDNNVEVPQVDNDQCLEAQVDDILFIFILEYRYAILSRGMQH